MIKAKEHEAICNFDSLEAIVYGGSILGGGGGGFLAEGLETVKLALGIGKPRIISLSQVAPNESLVMVATVGAPAGKNRFVKAEDFIGAVRKPIEASPCRVSGIITNEMGGRASANGLIQSAVLGLPIIDAPANGRAHPFGLMGSLLAEGAKVRKLAGGFKFVEGPAWDARTNALYFSDIPAAQIIRYTDGKKIRAIKAMN